MRKAKKLKFILPALIGVGALIGLYFVLKASSPLSKKTLAVNGQNVEYWQGGHGPHLVVVSPPDQYKDWAELARSWFDSYTLTILNSNSSDLLATFISSNPSQTFYLLGFGKGANLALAKAVENKDRITKLILISPTVEAPANWRANAAQITQPTLLLWGRNDPELKSDDIMALNRELPNAQMSFHPQGRHDLITKNADWVAGKVSNFISFTR